MKEDGGPGPIEPIYTELGKRLAALRKERGLTQESLSDRAGVSANYLARTEGGYHRPNLARLEGIAEALDVSVAALFSNRVAAPPASISPSLLAELEKLSRDDQHLVLQLAKRLSRTSAALAAGATTRRKPRKRRPRRSA
jgi:transcriptional regulator with XRE-family HTH domain